MQNISGKNLQDAQGDRLAASPFKCVRTAGIGRTTLYATSGTGKLRFLKISKQRSVTIKWLEKWFRSAEQRSTGDQ